MAMLVSKTPNLNLSLGKCKVCTEKKMLQTSSE